MEKEPTGVSAAEDCAVFASKEQKTKQALLKENRRRNERHTLSWLQDAVVRHADGRKTQPHVPTRGMLILSPAAAPPFDGCQRESALRLAGDVTG